MVECSVYKMVDRSRTWSILNLRLLLSVMTRERSKSVVQKIAFDTPSYTKEDLELKDESTEARNIQNPTVPSLPHIVAEPTQFSGRRRANSFCCFAKESNALPVLQPSIFHPFTKAERELLTQNFLDTLNYNSVLDLELIGNINDMFDNDILAFKTDCDSNISHMQSIMAENKTILNEINSLTLQFDKVTRDTRDFAYQSSSLMNKSVEIESKVGKIDSVLKMFDQLEKITKTLISAGNSIIRTGRILEILNQLQECLDFLQTHSSYKDSEFYSLRYRQCMTRGLTLIRNYLIDYLKTIPATFMEKLKSQDVSDLTLDVYMYNEPVNNLEKHDQSIQFLVLLGAVVERCVSHKEYRGLVSDILNQYFKFRLLLIWIYIEKQERQKHEDATNTSNSTVFYCQKQISLYKKLLEKERALFSKFCPFEEYPSQQHAFILGALSNFFKQALEPLYDEVRNRILREQSITELCNVTNLLANYYEYEDDVSIINSTDRKIEYGELFEPMMQDSQSRLVFRIQNYIDNKLLKYKPRPEDLQLGHRKSTEETLRRESELMDIEENLFPSLYVPLGMALTILSNVYELLNSMVFDDIAHHVVHSCIFMLKNSAMKLAITHLGTLEAKLFYLKNLITLKNQLNNFDIQFVRTETSLDFTSGIHELFQILKNGQLYVKFNESGGFLELVRKSTPKVVNNMIDAKHEIELELSNGVNDLITECTNIVCEPILLDNKLSLKEKSVPLNDNVLMKIPHFYSQFVLFVEEREIALYLIDLTVNLISSTYEKYYSSLQEKLERKDYTPQDMEDIMEPDTFFHFVSEVVSGLNEENERSLFNDRYLEVLDLPQPIFGLPQPIKLTQSPELMPNIVSQTESDVPEIGILEDTPSAQTETSDINE